MQGGSPEFRKQPGSEIITAPAAGYLFLHGILQKILCGIQEGVCDGTALSAKEASQQSAVVLGTAL